MPEVATPPAPAPTTPAAPGAKADPLFNPAMDEAFKSFDQPKEAPKPDAKPVEKPAADKPKTEVKPKETPKADDKPVEKAADKIAEKPKPEEKKTPEALEQFSSFKELRTKYEETKRRAESHESKIKEYEAKLAEAAKTGSPADEKVWQEKIAAKEKDLQALQAKLAETDFTQSEDYQEKYWKPYVNSYTRAIAAMTGFQAQNADGTTRPITKEDAELLLSLPETKSYELAKDLFGEGSHALAVMAAHKIRITEAKEALDAGKASFQKIADERRNKQFVEQQQMGETIGKLWQKGNQEFIEKSKWLKPDESDPEGSELLAKGFERADKAFTQDAAMKPEDRVALHVELRNKAAAYDRLVHTIDKLSEERDALKKERDELMDSAPKSDTTAPKVDEDADKRPSELIDKIPWGKR